MSFTPVTSRKKREENEEKYGGLWVGRIRYLWLPKQNLPAAAADCIASSFIHIRAHCSCLHLDRTSSQVLHRTSIYRLVCYPRLIYTDGTFSPLRKMGRQVMPAVFFCLLAFDIPLFRYLGPVPHDSSYYAKCMLGGVLACGLTHAGITPLDVAKCNIQVCPIRSFQMYDI